MDFGLDYKFVHKNGNGEVVWESDWEPNQMANEGFEQMFDVYFRAGTAPTGFYIVLLTAASTPTKTTTIGTMTEIAGTNYVPATNNIITRNNTGFPTLALDSADMEIITKSTEFENTGSSAWTAAGWAALISVTDGGNKFVSWKALSASRTLQPQDKLEVTIKQKGKI